MQEPEEIWRPVQGYEGIYEVSSLGRLKSLKRLVKFKNKNGFYPVPEKIIKLSVRHRYQSVGLYNGKHKNHLVHRLVAIAFVQNTTNQLTVNHKDGNRLNNKAENLEWCSQSENVTHAYTMGLSKDRKVSNNSMSKLTEKIVSEIRYYCQTNTDLPRKETALKYGIAESTLSQIVNNKRWNHLKPTT